MQSGDIHMPAQIILGVYRRLDNRIEGFSDDSPRAVELHNRRKEALHDVFDREKNIEVLDWEATDDTRTHEYVELAIALVGQAVFTYAVVPGLKFICKKLTEKAIDKATSELVAAIVSWLRGPQESKKILDFEIKLPDGTTIKVNPPDPNATISISFADGQIEYITYAQLPHAETSL
jgi:hypothetical protein